MRCRAFPERGSMRGPSSSAIRCFLLFRDASPPCVLLFAVVRLDGHYIAFLDDMVVGPKQMSGHAAPWTPGFGEFRERLGVGSLAQAKSDACRFLDGEIAGGEREIGRASCRERG